MVAPMAIREGLIKVFITCQFCVHSCVGVGYIVCVGDCSIAEPLWNVML